MNPKNVVFTPLRIALIFFIIVANVLAIISMFAKQSPWAEALGVFAVVFIMLFVFVILLELVWLHHRAKEQRDPVVINRYRTAKIIYVILFTAGFLVSYWAILS